MTFSYKTNVKSFYRWRRDAQKRSAVFQVVDPGDTSNPAPYLSPCLHVLVLYETPISNFYSKFELFS